MDKKLFRLPALSAAALLAAMAAVAGLQAAAVTQIDFIGATSSDEVSDRPMLATSRSTRLDAELGVTVTVTQIRYRRRTLRSSVGMISAAGLGCCRSGFGT